MTTTHDDNATTHCMPDTTDPGLPPGTVSLDGWQQDSCSSPLPLYRMFSGRDRRVDGVDGVIGTSAVQYVDGSVDDGRVDEAPCIWVGMGADSISSAQARQLADALVSAADEVDGWVTR